MKMSELKVGMFCVINEEGIDHLCVILPSPYDNDDRLVFTSITGQCYGMVDNADNRDLSLVFSPRSNYDLCRTLQGKEVPTVDDLSSDCFEILYVKDDKASKIQARIDTLHSELNQLTQELNSL